jgi:regulator of replication initiation timing
MEISDLEKRYNALTDDVYYLTIQLEMAKQDFGKVMRQLEKVLKENQELRLEMILLNGQIMEREPPK